MNIKFLLSFILLSVLAGFIAGGLFLKEKGEVKNAEIRPQPYWFILHRKSNQEELFKGVPGEKEESKLVKSFSVKTGIPGETPTPLPKLLGKSYFLITGKQEEKENPETAPYFLTLNIPAPTDQPFGPTPYNECNGQCNWNIPGAFGLHGVGGIPERLTNDDPGSSGCIRHSDSDITYLYNILDPSKTEIRYYIEDN